MLIRAENKTGLDLRAFLDIYEEGIRENAAEFYPDEPAEEAVRREEESFSAFLDEFFAKPGNTYWILEEDGAWVSALRLSRVEPGFYYLEALETRPDYRRKGCAARLIRAVTAELEKQGPVRICDCVSKRNTASVRTHERCGFRIVSGEGFDYLSGTVNDRTYGMEYVTGAEKTRRGRTAPGAETGGLTS
ncbi:MAG: GNAT family N-acetyltransferase [Lachnospiraceae bacterium]|nr:GNAT family N-acetyltransferase [Lachnospiraceae bacterium]